MIAVELCCSSIKGNADPGVVFASLGVFGVALVVMVLIRRRMPNPPRSRFSGSIFGSVPPRIRLNKTLIDGQEVTVLDQASMSHLIDPLRTPAAMKAALLANPDLMNEITTALSGATSVDPNGPLPVVARVRSAVLNGQLETVRPLVSDQLYERLKASPMATPKPSTPQLIMTTNQQTGDDPNRVVVAVIGSTVIPGAGRENWVMVRMPQSPEVSMAAPQPSQPAAPVTTCPYCSAQLDAGSTRCRFCGMDVTMAAPTVTPAPAPATVGWIVEDITAANQQAA